MVKRPYKHNIKYDTMKIPEGLTAKIDDMIQKHGYTSRTDVIKTAVRFLYRDRKKKKKR